MVFSPVAMLTSKYDLGATVASLNSQSTHATDMTVQSGTSTPSITTSAGGALATTSNATADPDAKSVMYGAVGIVLVALILLWLLGAIVFKRG